MVCFACLTPLPLSHSLPSRNTRSASTSSLLFKPDNLLPVRWGLGRSTTQSAAQLTSQPATPASSSSSTSASALLQSSFWAHLYRSKSSSESRLATRTDLAERSALLPSTCRLEARVSIELLRKMAARDAACRCIFARTSSLRSARPWRRVTKVNLLNKYFIL